MHVVIIRNHIQLVVPGPDKDNSQTYFQRGKNNVRALSLQHILHFTWEYLKFDSSTVKCVGYLIRSLK